MNSTRNNLSLVAALAALAMSAATVLAHPLPGRDLEKFGQQPMDQTQAFGQVWWGHDEESTAYAPFSTVVPAPPTVYRGRFMADDFADTLTTPVVHVKWWGSYMNNTAQHGQIQKFLIAFESDVPTPNPLGFSYPDPTGPIHSQIVTLGGLFPQSGTFTEQPVSPGGPPLFEGLYEYNAELAIPFPQQKDTVHWLKIVALVDHNPAIQPGPGAPLPLWGWHNRDYTLPNTSPFISTAVSPGETNQGTALAPIWHFQDDAVSGVVDVGTFINTNGVQQVGQVNQYLPTFNDEHYVDNWDGPSGISQYSKDLAFRLYTLQIPEPASCLLMVAGLAGVVAVRRGRQG